MEPVSILAAAILIFAVYSHNSTEPQKIPKKSSEIEQATFACESSMLKKYQKGSLSFECEKLE
tara:strand:- start:858 stop:1046 length:189 start_codon:yes stop_codon:yes gene_type:complete